MPEQSKVGEIASNVKEYVNIHWDIIKLDATGKLSTVGAAYTCIMVVLMAAGLVAIFLGVAAGFYLSYLTGSQPIGFLLVGMVYIIGGIILVVYRQKLVINPVRNAIIRQLLSNEQQHN